MSELIDLFPERIVKLLDTARYGRSLRVVEATGSTNDDARMDAEAGAPSGHVVVADTQRSGRGSKGRAWSSPAGTDLYLSIVDRIAVAPSELPPLTLAAGLGVSDAVQALVGQSGSVGVKWPNDVLLHGRKCAGILVEASSAVGQAETVIIGIGLNVNRQTWLPELEQTATSIRQLTGQYHDRATVLAQTLQAVERRVDCFVNRGPGPIVEALRERLALRGQRVSCGNVTGTLSGVADSGALIIETDTGPQLVTAGTLVAVPKGSV